MKKEYDPEGEDYMTEQIVKQIETGALPIPASYRINK